MHDKLSDTISTLDDWSTLEYPHESSTTLDNLYYGKERAKYHSIDELRQGVRKARTLILAGYNECRPRREILKILDAVEEHTSAQVIKT